MPWYYLVVFFPATFQLPISLDFLEMKEENMALSKAA